MGVGTRRRPIGQDYAAAGMRNLKVRGSAFVVVLDKILIPEHEHEDEYEKYQIRSHA